jgi:hypothetical protein
MTGTAFLLTGSRRRGDQKRTAIPALRRRSFSSSPVAGVLSYMFETAVRKERFAPMSTSRAAVAVRV